MSHSVHDIGSVKKCRKAWESAQENPCCRHPTGEKIWTIASDNLELALSKINLGDEAETDIRNAVNAGKVATAHEYRINFNGLIGEGYTLIDPQGGAGAYMISGGGNGGVLIVIGLSMLLFFSLSLGPLISLVVASRGLLLAPAIIASIYVVAVAIGLILEGMSIILGTNGNKELGDTLCTWSGYAYNVAIGTIFAFFANGKIGQWIRALIGNERLSISLGTFVVIPTIVNVATDRVNSGCK